MGDTTLSSNTAPAEIDHHERRPADVPDLPDDVPDLEAPSLQMRPAHPQQGICHKVFIILSEEEFWMSPPVMMMSITLWMLIFASGIVYLCGILALETGTGT